MNFGLGKDNTINIYKEFVKNLSDKYEMITIAGKNEKMKKEFEIYKNENVKVYGFIDFVPKVMAISDLVVTKPGGLTSTECIVSSLPMVLINPIPGQEIDNAKFFVKSKCAILLRNNGKNNEKIIFNLLNDDKKINFMKKNTKLIAKKDACKSICDILLNS